MISKQPGNKVRTGGFKKGTSGNPAGRPRTRTDADDLAARQAPFTALMPHLDGWVNANTGLGMSTRDKSIGAYFEVDPVSAEDALGIWRGNPMAARIIETIPNECIRQGVDVCIGDAELPEPYTPPEQEPAQTVPGTPGAKPTGSLGKKVGPGRDDPRHTSSLIHTNSVVARETFTYRTRTRSDAWLAYAAKHPSAFTRRIRVAVREQHRRMDASDAKPLQEAVQKRLQALQALQMIREAMCYERAGGGGALLIGANDYTTDLRQPLDLKKVRSFDYLTPLEGRELIPLYYYNDPRAPKFGQVAIYQLVPYVIGAPIDPAHLNARVTQIHESRLIIFPGARVSRRIVSSSGTWGWGDSVLTRVVRALRAYDTGHQSAEVLLQDFAQAVYKVKGLADLLARDPNALLNSAVSVELGRSICRAVVVDAEEDFERKSTSLAGYAELLQMFAQNLAAAAEHPLTLLMGSSPGGLNATGASDIRFFYDRVASTQQNRVGPALMRIVEVILASMGEDPDKINHSIYFHPLWQPTEKEVAEAHFTQAQADAIYLDRDVVSPEEMALSRFGGDKWSSDTIIDFEARAAQQAMVAPTVNAKPEPPPPVQTGFDTPMPAGAKTPEQRDIPPQAGEVD